MIPRGNQIRITGAQDEVDVAFRVITDLLAAQRGSQSELTEQQIRHAMNHNEERLHAQRQRPAPAASHAGNGVPQSPPNNVQELLGEVIHLPSRRNRLTPLTEMQKHYIHAIRSKDIIFCIGPAGTGKTYLAMAMAAHCLLEKIVDRIILVRPVVEAGEHLGFLPGDIAQKFDPYVRPLYDALYEMMEAETIREHIANGTIEIAPLAYMRGRTMNNAFIILDEAQNSSGEQMKMMLTRLGFNSKLVITGDITQVDLPKHKSSGLAVSEKILGGIEEIAFVHFTRKDVVRHQLVQKIIQAYESNGQK